MHPSRAAIGSLLFTHIFVQISSIETNLIAVHDNDELLVQCTYKLIKKYFHSGESLSGSVLAVSITSASPDLQSHMLQAFHLDLDYTWSIIVRYPREFISLKPSTIILHQKPQTYFVVLENLDDDEMDNVFDDWKSMANWNPLAQFVVYFSAIEDTTEEMTELMVEILLIFMSRKIFNINVIALTPEAGHIRSLTALPYEPENHCGTRVVAFQTLDVCDFEDEEAGTVFVEEQSRGLFSDKIPKDLSGCLLMAYSRSWEPYVFVEDGQMKGIEWLLVQTIADSLHMGIRILIQNSTMFHIFEELIDGNIDIVIGGIDEDPNLINLVSASVPYLQDDLTWCVTKAKKTFHWLSFLQVFTAGTYVTYIGFIVLNAAVIYMIQQWPFIKAKPSADFVTIFFILVGCALSQSTRSRNLQSSIRICLMMSLTASLVLGSVYNSFLISFITSPTTFPQIKKTTEIFENEMSVTGSVDIIRHLEKDGDVFKYIRREFLMCYNIEECLQRAAYDQHVAVAVSRQYSLHNPRIPRNYLYCFVRDENIYTYLVTMLMPKKFHLFHQINPIIQYVIESGHFLKWTRDLELQRVLKSTRNLDNDVFMSLKMNQIIGALAFNEMLLLFAIFVFMLEKKVYRMYMRGTRVKIVKILHKNFVKRK